MDIEKIIIWILLILFGLSICGLELKSNCVKWETGGQPPYQYAKCVEYK